MAFYCLHRLLRPKMPGMHPLFERLVFTAETETDMSAILTASISLILPGIAPLRADLAINQSGDCLASSAVHDATSGIMYSFSGSGFLMNRSEPSLQIITNAP